MEDKKGAKERLDAFTDSSDGKNAAKVQLKNTVGRSRFFCSGWTAALLIRSRLSSGNII